MVVGVSTLLALGSDIGWDTHGDETAGQLLSRQVGRDINTILRLLSQPLANFDDMTVLDDTDPSRDAG